MANKVVHRRARKYLERMDDRIKTQLIAKLEVLAQNPESTPNVKLMEGDFALSGWKRFAHGAPRHRQSKVGSSALVVPLLKARRRRK